ncbi:MAG: hypothetical protein K6E29_08300 [Cyanobacteria bacterium RUI128]|nr:hypothetical protein [Cyanobacteria bacterium RUI128]
MGMSSSQARLLTLTGRMHDIEYKAAKIEAQKLQMANESRRVYDTYLNALEASKVQFQTINTDGSTGYLDANYYDLCMGNSVPQFGLFDPQTGSIYLPEAYVNAYNSAGGSASAFATTLSGYVPPEPPVTPGGGGVTPGGGGVTPGGGGETPSGGGVTPGSDPEEPEEGPTTPITPGDNNLELYRGNNRNASIDTTGITLTLKNPFSQTSGQEFVYNIKSNSGSSNVNFRFLNNGRLVIEGSNLTVTASAGQNDDLIINGHNNTINTEDGDDLIRLGMAQDGKGCIYAQGGTVRSTMLQNEYNSCIKNTYGNTINAGAGNDHIFDLTGGQTNSGYTGNTINGGSGTDSYKNYDVSILEYLLPSGLSSPDFSAANTIDHNNVSGIETNYNVTQTSKQTATTNGNLEAFAQGGLGDCRFISLLSALALEGKTLSDLGISISSSGSQYTVTFNKYNGSGNKSITFNQSELYPVATQNVAGYGEATLYRDNVFATGDLDARIVEYAINKLMINNNGGHNLETNSYQNYSRYLFGTANTSFYMNPSDTAGYTSVEVNGGIINCSAGKVLSKALMQGLWNKKENGTISNLLIGTYTGDQGYNANLQICDTHAYAVTDVQDEYIELLNPWDNQDRVRISWSDFLDLVQCAYVFGDTSSDSLTNITTGGEMYQSAEGTFMIEHLSNESDSNENTPEEIPQITIAQNQIIHKAHSTEGTEYSITVNQLSSLEPESSAKYNALVNLFSAIQQFGCKVMPDNMMKSEEYLINTLNGGYAYLKMYDKKEGKWVDTSIATNTSLREVDNEKELKKAEAKYEADMRKIDLKDRRYDTELAALDNERNAIKSEMETLKNVAKDNVERTFKLFS